MVTHILNGSNEELAEAYQTLSGSDRERVFTELYARLRMPLLGFICQRVTDKDDACHVVNVAFIRSLAAFSPTREGTFRGLLYRVARNYAFDLMRARRAEQLLVAEYHDAQVRVTAQV